ncbi:HEPN domain-containing protein [Sulfurisphaera ohwakuensis]|uniref:HEPN domain-containing protein n=1 Tax=Sulfurisphaera ohwakuensis TaxID=69656 RepID=A0A650CF67_SULOH|nr:HEPN domain-containing protein [Sulfurisphaera ohwakuensis]MBB5254767.1 HEPN domain-containing protein [Sulfurisphaera ohwakuensis]QGR16398.1 HEPN domain-containing protein [Sulfurisphaera ohwakuensis]
MSVDLYEILKERSKYFYKESMNDSKNKRYDIALFHLEQALQLGLKAYLLKNKGDFPRTHSLRDLIDLTDNECLKRVIQRKWYIISLLTDAYVGSRYLLRNYTEKEYKASKKFVEEALKCLNIIES